MSDALLRVSDAHRLEVDDIGFMEDGSGRALLRETKTDREGTGVVQYLGPSTVERIRAWLSASGVREGRLFRNVRRGGHAAAGELGVRSIRQIIVDRAREIGVRERVSSHSLRVGSAQSLAERNASLVGMQRAGNWASPSMPAYYTREQEAGFGYVARLRYGVELSTVAVFGRLGEKKSSEGC